MAEWLQKLCLRIAALPPGTYVIVLHINGEHKWSLAKLGKLEKP